ncbi:D-alanyl-D-alanine carboxypeptidase [Streptomyces olivoverticillatus]|uniref:D-alanyl-D-alanine carboxypeptidase n=1 Tax=Streptomyces olivoverticillatus TaxID=66427 RepID=A0A7W7PLH2_9ACTN|nr:serine hydrolase domain-containing protein [Streptomyces olivoverticillatus]MBB4893418.1 D-alanyl-D-alanine carboxypeptidase [Streptomyces olivoverticillatus]
MTIRTVRRAVVAAVVAATATAALTTTASADPAHGNGSHAATEAAMEAQVKNAGVPGILGQVQDKNGTWNASAGVADLQSRRPRLPQDRFRVGSISKAFTSVVLLQLEAEGKLRLDDTVEHHLPGVVQGHGHDGNKITVRQLLNHTSGVFNYTEDPTVHAWISTGFPEHRYDTHTPKELVAAAMRHQPSFAPGQGWHYSNTNYILAGMIVEKVTGHPYASEIDRRVLRPLGLRSTTLPGSSVRMPSPHGRAYSKLFSEAPDAKIYDVTELNPSWGWAAGEIISTTGDLNRFYRALLRGDLLPRHQQQELLTTVPTGDAIPGGRYGLGVMAVKLSCDKTVWMHSGGIHGSTSLATSTADGRHTSAFNFNDDWAADLDGLVQAEYCGTAKPPAGSRTPSPVEALAELR